MEREVCERKLVHIIEMITIQGTLFRAIINFFKRFLIGALKHKKNQLPMTISDIKIYCSKFEEFSFNIFLNSFAFRDIVIYAGF